MTWISRLLPEQSSPRRRATRTHQDRTAKARRRRRDVSLERLESRQLLAGNITIPPTAMLGGPLVITGDLNGDVIPIRINAGGTVAVGPTFINGAFQTFNTLAPVTSITVNLPGGGNNNPNTVSITGPGKGVPTTVGNITVISPAPEAANVQPAHALNLTITGVNSSGMLDVEQLGRVAFPNSGALTASVTNSVFSSLEIEQEGCCPAVVTLSGDRVQGLVEVYEGFANGDSIILGATATGGPNVFGSTILQQWTPDPDAAGEPQGAPPLPVNNPACVGANDLICVTAANVAVTPVTGRQTIQDLTIIQGGIGSNQQVVVDGLYVNPNSFGVRVTQTGGAQTGGGNNGPAGPAAKVVVCNVTTVPGQLPNFPGINVPLGASVNITQSTPNANAGAGGNYADVAGIVLPGDININQLSDGGNWAQVLNSDIGLGFFLGPFFQEFGGTIRINQPGGGRPNTAILDRVIANNAFITQGNNLGAGDCFGPSPGSIVQVNDTTIFSDLYITQGTSDLASTGGNIVAIGAVVRTSDPGLPLSQWRCPVGADCFDAYAATPVYAFDTDIVQYGQGNTLTLGGFPGETPAPTIPATGVMFTTTFLDAYTGSGGATVNATYVNVIGGSDDVLAFGNGVVIGFIEGGSSPFNVQSTGAFNVFNLNTHGTPNADNNFSVTFDPSFAVNLVDYGF